MPTKGTKPSQDPCDLHSEDKRGTRGALHPVDLGSVRTTFALIQRTKISKIQVEADTRAVRDVQSRPMPASP